MVAFLEAVTFAFFVVIVAHATATRGEVGRWFFAALVFAGFVRESAVALWKWLYAMAPLLVRVGPASALASIIWALSVWAAIDWAEGVSGERWAARRPPGRLLVLVATFMIALAGFYEPLLARVGMARWEVGTRSTAGVPWIALVGYPTFAVAFLLVFGFVLERWSRAPARALAFVLLGAPLGVAHAALLQALKGALGW